MTKRVGRYAGDKIQVRLSLVIIEIASLCPLYFKGQGMR
jgi:hypothetical protein